MSRENILLPFQFHMLPVRGRVLRLRDVAAHVPSLKNPTACSQTLAELLAAAALLAYDTKHEMSVGLQIRHADLGVLLFAQCVAKSGGQGGGLRAYANDAAQGTPFESIVKQPGGIFAVTLENLVPEGDMPQRYQSFVALQAPTAAGCLAEYFAQSVQTRTELLVFANGTDAGAIMLQALPGEDLPNDDWARLGMILKTIKTEELLADDAAEDLLAKLFAEDDVSTFAPETPTFAHEDPRPRMLAALASLPRDELAELQRQPHVTLTDATSGIAVTFSAEDIAHLGDDAGEQ